MLEGVLLLTLALALSGPCGDLGGRLVTEGSWCGRWEQKGVPVGTEHFHHVHKQPVYTRVLCQDAIWPLDAFGP